MTALNVSQIPSWINTVEKIHAWSGAILADLNPTATVVTAPGQAELVVNASDFRFPNDTQNPNRYAVIAYLPLGVNYRSMAQFRAVSEISSAAIPSAFLGN